MQNNKIIIIGGGLAGLIAAIHLSKIGFKIIVLEKNTYPKHKVCGEYISNEVLDYLKYLDIDIQDLQPSNINKLHFATTSGKSLFTDLPLGGFGVSRFALDEFLYKKAMSVGCEIHQENVENISFNEDFFIIKTTNGKLYESEIAIGAFGKKSNIDQQLKRKFTFQKSPWLGVKAHYKVNFDDDLVGLYNFDGGYCGVSKVENNIVNICYLASFESFKKYKNIKDFQQKVLCKNPILKNIFENAELIFEKELTISQISFENKNAVENHILMIGDTAGLINPLCGNGMAMAIHSAKIVSEQIEKYANNEIKLRQELEISYQKIWNFNFKSRIKTGKILASIMQKPILSNFLLSLLVIFPSLLKIIIKKTHGKPI